MQCAHSTTKWRFTLVFNKIECKILFLFLRKGVFSLETWVGTLASNFLPSVYFLQKNFIQWVLLFTKKKQLTLNMNRKHQYNWKSINNNLNKIADDGFATSTLSIDITLSNICLAFVQSPTEYGKEQHRTAFCRNMLLCVICSNGFSEFRKSPLKSQATNKICGTDTHYRYTIYLIQLLIINLNSYIPLDCFQYQITYSLALSAASSQSDSQNSTICLHFVLDFVCVWYVLVCISVANGKCKHLILYSGEQLYEIYTNSMHNSIANIHFSKVNKPVGSFVGNNRCIWWTFRVYDTVGFCQFLFTPLLVHALGLFHCCIFDRYAPKNDPKQGWGLSEREKKARIM